MVVFFVIKLSLYNIDRIIANKTYIIVQTIGITMLGIHWDGVCNCENQFIPKLTNKLPRPATINIEATTNIIFKVSLFIFFIFLCYVVLNKLWENIDKYIKKYKQNSARNCAVYLSEIFENFYYSSAKSASNLVLCIVPIGCLGGAYIE